MNALTTPTSPDCFAARFGTPLPRALRADADTMSWTAFAHRYSAGSSPIRLGTWTTSAAPGGRTTFDATFGIGDTIHTASATTHGPIDALTSMLYDAGFHLEIISFHQQHLASGTQTATFVLCEFDGRRRWAMAIDGDATQSSIRALIGAANMLH
ncbi:MAG: alpha-isopropylmalate synthase regulatory domain-containing protein [Rhodococcus sp. (in: high G+C Gram-positive bacteria)]|jgi:hypothetical protein|uniref:alpha-isopropylmalate synthase regulatory domain-containing protein n=1 Tax=Rhodococcoides yunnanense TaxID=278209 RepID=UPI0022B1D032|nr:alpha-isopropylmalate synthase regulatory domain-containing protein [Rhodococcus yunnanensis]MCZ4275708.1 2-isopropylmalate synthase [Rhodococcus yunnanensis]